MRFAVSVALVTAALLFTAQTSFAQATPGQILFTENEIGANSVVDIRPGGDLSAAGRFATGLSRPTSICIGPGGDVYVTEFDSGEVTIITAGGDFSGVGAFATGLSSPTQLVCDAAEILVLQGFGDAVIDITAGGDFTGAPGFATGLVSGSALFRDSNGTLWVNDSTLSGRLFDITAGGDFTGVAGYAFGTFVPGIGKRAGALLASEYNLTSIGDFTAGGNLSSGPDFAQLVNPIGMLDVGPLGLFVATSTPDVYEVSAGGDFTSGPVYATGTLTTGWWNGMAFVPGCGSGVIEGTEECDDNNTIDGDGCDSSCLIEVCGNAVVQSGEECDDGNTVDGDGCDSLCVIEECGNSVIQSGEDCDDGNTVAADGCDENCVIELCGNAVTQPATGEECDDGNTIDFDGCSGGCLLESCGDGVMQPSEGCDDSNTVDGDGCDSLCVAEVCGNGALQAGEACDDGNVVDEDGCSSTCGVESCGDGVLQAGLGEVCDDGNVIDGDGCSATCTAISYCTAAPSPSCALAAKASLKISEKKAGNEKLKVSLKKFDLATDITDFGDPATGTTVYGLCVYDGADALIASLSVDRAGDTCGTKPCWKTAKGGYKYKDKLAASDGVKKITTKSGTSGKGKVKVQAANKAKKDQAELPVGVTAALSGATSATVQVMASDASCTAATLTTVKKNDASEFKAKTP